MTQPSGTVLGLTSHHAFFLRSSPIICALDALIMMARFVYLTFVVRSVRAAAQGIARERLGDINGDAKNSLDQVEKNTIFRVALFVLGALPQFLKLYGLSGVTWPKVWASVFLGTFVTTEIIVLLIGRGWEKAPIKTSTLRKSMSLVNLGALCLGLLFTLVFFNITINITISRIELSQQYLTWIRWSSIAILPIYISILVIILAFSRRDTRGTTYILFIFVLSVVCTPFAAISSHLHGVIFSVSVSLYFMLDNLTGIFDHGGSINARHLRFIMEAHYLFLNLSGALIFYCFVFNSQGTYKPAWTEYLG
ncbi:MAG: hypothetical protein LQ342_002756 [Letrouitia transgressa]|nr:MAG: hypothetical protein LQ342_002756 [Letrouitia transgressa]